MCNCRFFGKLREQPREVVTQTARDIRDAIILMLAFLFMEVCYNRINRNTDFAFSNASDMNEAVAFQRSFCTSDSRFYSALIGYPLIEEFQFRVFYLTLFKYLLTAFTRALCLKDRRYAEMGAIVGQALLFSSSHHKATRFGAFTDGLMFGYLAMYNNAGVFASSVAHIAHNGIALAETCVLRGTKNH